MSQMFSYATSFNGDLSKWDVSSVKDMSSMFLAASSFNRDLSSWDVSSVFDMDGMFFDARSFNQKLCGAAWVHSTASKEDMFAGSSGSISRTVCPVVPYRGSGVPGHGPRGTTMVAPYRGSQAPGHGPIGEWDVSRITDTRYTFSGARYFNQVRV